MPMFIHDMFKLPVCPFLTISIAFLSPFCSCFDLGVLSLSQKQGRHSVANDKLRNNNRHHFASQLLSTMYEINKSHQTHILYEFCFSSSDAFYNFRTKSDGAPVGAQSLVVNGRRSRQIMEEHSSGLFFFCFRFSLSGRFRSFLGCFVSRNLGNKSEDRFY